MAKEKFNLFNMFYRPGKDGKGVKKEKQRPLNFINFFMTLPRRFGKLVSLNLVIIFGNFPLIFPLLAATGYFSTLRTGPAYDMFGTVYSLMKHQPSPAVSSLWGIYGVQVESHLPNTTTMVLYALGLLSLLLLGPICTGCAYVTRNLVRGESVSVLSDFFYAIKRNFRQGFILGLIDAFLSVMLVWDILFFYSNSATGGMIGMMFILSLCMAVIYFFMRFYMYQILVTFELSIFKILKNSLIFSLLGIWRNLVATLGMVAIIILTYSFLAVYLPLALAVVVICGFSLCVYLAAYAAYPKVKEYMIDPYYKEEEYSYFNEGDDEEDPGEPICRDDA